MSTIKIQGLTMENFKCHAHFELELEGRSAGIYGDNATGKTSVYDAFCWLLFGKDSKGQSDEKAFCIKPLDLNGEVKDHDAITSVKAELLVDGESLTLERTLREVWSTRRGASESVFTGNTSDYFVDGVPCKKNEYERRIGELISEDVFRLLTDLRYFPEKMKWQDRRKVLFEISGTYSDGEIMDTDPRFGPLKEAAGRLSLEDYGKKLAAEKRGLTVSRDEIPARIDELQRRADSLRDLDFLSAKQAAEELEAEKEALSVQLAALHGSAALQTKKNEIDAARLEKDKLEAENAAFRREQEIRKPDAEGLARELEQLRRKAIAHRDRIDTAETKIKWHDQEIEKCRARWNEANKESFSGGLCPTCGQELPADKLKAAKEQFEERKQRCLSEIERNANQIKDARAGAVERVSGWKSELFAMEETEEKLETALAEARSDAVTVSDMADYAGRKAALTAQVQSLTEEYRQMEQSLTPQKAKLREQMQRIGLQIAEQREIVAQERALKDMQTRIGELRQQARAAAERLDQIASLQFLMDEFTRYKAGFVEDGVNRRFRLAKFRLYRAQANGGAEDRCDVTYDGVPYSSLNNGMKINVGIDIINTLSEAYGASVPLFIDNAESVTKLEPSDAQIIRLAVSEGDKELRREYED